MKLRLLPALAFVALLPAQAQADGPSAQAIRQIDHLIAFIEASPCAFIRNGTEYDGPAAADHIRAKYRYYRDRIRSAEDFIDRTATRSELSGRPYQVHCPGAPVLPAADWLRLELLNYRANGN